MLIRIDMHDEATRWPRPSSVKIAAAVAYCIARVYAKQMKAGVTVGIRQKIGPRTCACEATN